MKKSLIFSLMAVFALAACSKEEKDEPQDTEKSLVGVWLSNETSAAYEVNGVTIFDSTATTKAGRWEFTSNGMIIISVNAGESDPFDIFEEDTAYYTRNNNMLMVKDEASEPDDSAVAVEIMTLTESQLDLMFSETEQDGGITETSTITVKMDKQ